MKNILLLCLFFLTSSHTNTAPDDVHLVHTYTNIPEWYTHNDFWLKSTVVSFCEWLNYLLKEKTITYIVDHLICDDGTSTFIAYNCHWIVFIRFNHVVHYCQIELFTDGIEFDESQFKELADFYFLYT